MTLIPNEPSTFTEGGVIGIICIAEGIPKPTIQWLRGNTYLYDIGKVR